jgi:transcriptional regulator with XRE-family HTH domain
VGEETTSSALSWRKDLGNRLAELRRERRWSLEKLAAESGVSAGTISKLENGRVGNPGLEVVLLLQKALKVGSLDSLLGVTPSDALAINIRRERGLPVLE